MKKRLTLSTFLIILISTILLSSCSTFNNSSGAIELNISAAASLKEAMEEIQTEFKKINSNISLTINYGSSGSLEQQIEQGAPCDIFISAGQDQMKFLNDKSFLLENSDKDLIKNDLVLVGPKNSEINSISDLNTDKVKKIAIGEPHSVPAGKYADETFQNLNIKNEISSKLVFAKDVKEVLAWSTSGNADVGFVYKSDVLNDSNSKIIEAIPDDKHSAIIYPIGILKASKNIDASKSFEDFLFTDTCKKIFKKYGYHLT
ncbi:molybdate ABC transporter substrate-binding protein [Clostridium sp. HBUAS56017]|uniref:molybdate ABC transporter substrate-binding protein n=1 Tax=Clostridium sp. HBUAS56017 TaxID=2571128 RepID=UPI00117757AA|nr:molybdate ABC transporter substrate-binding protein [Clostridium sp. HBUAS56017]